MSYDGRSWNDCMWEMQCDVEFLLSSISRTRTVNRPRLVPGTTRNTFHLVFKKTFQIPSFTRQEENEDITKITELL
jgi:hypothetical protein